MRIADAWDFLWLLLPDFDTALPVDFLPQMLKLGSRFPKKPEKWQKRLEFERTSHSEVQTSQDK